MLLIAAWICLPHAQLHCAAAELPTTRLGIAGTRFTIDDRPVFLTGFSYYGALGAPEEFIREDLAELQSRGFNWLRVWATWGGYETNVSAVDAHGRAREPFLGRLKWLVTECDRRGLVVDVTLSRGKELPELAAHRRAVETLVTQLKPNRNWYLDLGNERDVGDARFVSLAELKELRQLARDLDPERLVTASFGGHDLSLEDVRGAVLDAGVDFLCPHRPRHAGSPGETEAHTRMVRELMKQVGSEVPVHYQEPFRRGYTSWQPAVEDFVTDLRGAINSGAAGWCFHNGGQRGSPGEQPRRSFDLREQSLMDQLDAVERQLIERVQSVLTEAARP